MNKRRLFVLATLALVLLLGTLAVEGADQEGPALNVTFTYTRLSTLNLGRVWTDEFGVWHVRDRIDYGLIDGDIQGNAVVVYNADMAGGSPAETSDDSQPILPSDGRAFGSMTIITSWSKLPLWTGDWRHVIVNGVVVDGEMTAYDPYGTQIMNITSIEEGAINSVMTSLVHTGTISRICSDFYQQCR